MSACKTCGKDAGGPIFWRDGVEWPDECHTCAIDRYRDYSERVTRAYIASGLTAVQAAAITGIDRSTLVELRDHWEQEGAAYIDGNHDAYLFEKACATACARLIAEGRRQGAARFGDVIPFPDRAERRTRKREAMK